MNNCKDCYGTGEVPDSYHDKTGKGDICPTCKEIVGHRFENISGKNIQFPNRVSDAFCWAPGERIDIMSIMPSYDYPGFCVHNIDYVGAEVCFETAWITQKILDESFKEIPK